MPKTNIKGGKKKKRGKNGLVENLKMIFIEEDQLYGQVIKILGNNRFHIKCFNTGDNENSEKLCILRGKMRKRVWINLNDIVIISLREFENNKADIVHKYTTDEANELKKLKLIPNIEIINGIVEKRDDINFNEELTDTMKDTHDTSVNNTNYFVFDYKESESESESE